MSFSHTSRRFLSAGFLATGAIAFVLASASPVSAACKNRGDLDKRYCDENGDMVADTPTDPSKLLDPDTLVFSYTPVEDPSVYENVFTEFMAYLSKKTGKKVKWYGADSYASQVEALRSGRLHVAGISTGPTVFGVNLAGYVPIAMLTMGLTGTMLTSWVGDGRLKSYGVRFVSQVWPGDTLTAKATVEALREEKGEHIVDLAISTINQDGQEVLRGQASARVDS